MGENLYMFMTVSFTPFIPFPVSGVYGYDKRSVGREQGSICMRTLSEFQINFETWLELVRNHQFSSHGLCMPNRASSRRVLSQQMTLDL